MNRAISIARLTPGVVLAEVRWLWSTWYGQLAILTVLTGLLWMFVASTPYLMLLALTRKRLGIK